MLWLLLFLLFPSLVQARGPANNLSVPTFDDDGDTREAISLTVTSETAVSPFDVMQTTLPALRIRWIGIVNPSETYDLMVGTYSTFTVDDKWKPVLSSSGSWGTSNHSKFWLKYPPGAKPEKVRGEIESE